MHLANEAGYLYVYSKKLMKINRQLHKLSGHAEKHAKKHANANSEKGREKHRKKHASTKNNIKELMKQHNHLMKSLNHHYVNFAHELRKEHSLKK
jgi:uncharacterized FlaG/YvyC family protein